MKKLLSLFVCGLMALTMTAAELNIYASGLKAGAVNDNKVEISYVLNAPATAVEVQLIANDAVAAAIPVTDAALLTKGAHTATIDLGTVAAGDYTWAVKATAAATTEVANCAVGTAYNFYLPQGLGVDNSPASPYFGQIYVAEPYAGAADGATARTQAQTAGLYVYNPLLEELNPANVGYTLGLTFTGSDRQQFKRVVVDETGLVYVNDNSTGKNIYQIDPKDFTKCTPLFGETKPFTTLNSIAVTGSGDNLVVYAVDNSNTTTGGTIVKFSGKTPYTKADTILQSAKFANQDNTIVLDGKGGFWLTQHRYSADAYNCLTHVSAAGVIDFAINSGENKDLAPAEPVSYRGYLALNQEGTVLALGGGKTINLYDVTYDATTGVPSLVKKAVAFPTMGNNIDGISFDVAGNIYVVCASTEIFYAYVVPKADNTYTTPAVGTITVAGAPAPAGESFTITFTESATLTGSDSSAKQTKLDSIVATGAEYVDSIYNANNVYKARIGRGLKLGTSSKTGYFTIVLKEAVKPTSIVISARRYNDKGETGLVLQKDTFTCAAEGEFADYTVKYDGNTEVKTIYISSINFRTYVKSVTVNYAAAEPVIGGDVEVTWDLNGGFANALGVTKAEDMYQALAKDVIAAKNAGFAFTLLAGFGDDHFDFGAVDVTGSTGLAFDISAWDMTFCKSAMFADKWGWLEDYIKETAEAAGKAWNSSAAFRYAVTAFFANSVRPNWPASADYTTCGISSDAWKATWGQYFELPARYATSTPLPTVYREGYDFVGWFNGETKVDAVTEACTLVAKWEKKAHNVTWNLDGGFANALCYASAADLRPAMYQALAADVYAAKAEGFAFAFASEFAGTFGPANTDGSEGIALDIVTFDMNFFDNEPYAAKWGWLRDYIKDASDAQGKSWNSSAAMRYALAAFFSNSVRPNWPASIDYKDCGISSTAWESYVTFAYPATWAELDELPVPVKPMYNFLGWYNGETKVEKVTADVALTAKWQLAKYEWVMNGGFANNLCVDKVEDIYQALGTDIFASNAAGTCTFTFASGFKASGVFGPANVDGSEGIALDIQAFDLTFFDKEPYAAKWAWLRDYIKTVSEAQEKAWNSSAAMRYALAAFFSNSIRASWPASIDYANCGISSDAWKETWGGYFVLPETFAADQEAPKAYRTNWEFAGWYKTADFAGDAVTTVGPKSTCTLYAKFNPTAAAVQGVALNVDTLRFQMPATGSLVATITPETAVNKAMTWKSSNENIATVNDGVVTALMPGEVTVTVTTEESGYTASAVVIITAAPGAVTGVAFSETAKTIEIGESFELTYAITPDTAYVKDVVIELSDSAVIAYVDGKVTALKKGTSTITVTTVDGNYKATCTVTVPEGRDQNFVVEKIWEAAAPAGSMMSKVGPVRSGAGWDGKFYYNAFLYSGNGGDSTIYVAEYKDGALTETALCKNPVNGSGMAIDDAGNMFFQDNFPNSMLYKGAILVKGSTEPVVIEWTDTIVGRTDFVNAFGDMTSADGAYVYYYAEGQTHLKYVHICNAGTENMTVKAGTVETPEVIAGSSTTYVMRAEGAGSKFLSHCRGNWFQYYDGTELVKWGPEMTPYMYTSDMGGDLITMKDQNGNEKTILLYDVSTLPTQKRTSEFAVRNMTDEMMIPDANDNPTHFTIDQSKVISNNCYSIFMKVQKVDDYTVYVNQFISGLGCSYWKISTKFSVSGVTLNKETLNLGVNETEALAATVAPVQATNKNITWASSDTTVAVVSEAGVVTGLAEGEAVITVTTEEGNFTASCTVKVEAVAYKLVKDIAEITDGTKVLFVNEAAGKAMAEQKANNRGTVAVEINAGYIQAAPAEAQVVKVGVVDGGYTFGIGADYLYAAGGGNYLRTGANAEKWTITLDTVFHIVSTANVEQNTMRYNTASGGLFSCYKAENSQKDVAIYRQIKATELPIIYNVTVPEGTKECWIAGEMNNWSFTQMEAVDATHYTVIIDGATKAHGYKYACHNDWTYVEKGAAGEEIANRVYSEADVVLSWAKLWTAVDNVTISGVFYSNGMIYNPMGVELFVYSAAGQLVAHDSQNIDMTGAVNGTYIVRAASGMIKFIK